MPQSKGFGRIIIAETAALIVLSAIFLGLRLYCKVIRRRGFWWDDHVLVASWICFAISGALIISEVHLGFGKDITEVDPALIPKIGLIGTIYGLFAVLSAAWSKTSFALTLIRLVDGWMNWFLWFLIVSMNIIMNLVIVFSFIKCTPAEKVWRSTVPGSCWNPHVATYYNIFAGAFSGVVDLSLCILAWMIIWKLSMRTREKIGVGIALTFGIFAAAAAAAKCVGMLGLGSKNRTLARVNIVIWSNAECAVTIMAASIPIMRILVLRVCRRSPDQISNQPLRTLRIISTRDKTSSADNVPPHDNQGTAMANAKPHVFDEATFLFRMDSDRRSSVGAYGIERITAREL
ncbi:related to integral membrane protein pth11 [Fusarium torulosum]|uniref:Related to integral membrane protein pth11 n=1 Tax=Fusarium torulosum TaxID=33205 RepID=A0AAE8MAB0_9HYPO|nr:related to integral membrane protein pth11 [Fusarium torulosum]